MYTSCEAMRLFLTVTFPKRLSLRSFQHPKINLIFSILSLQFKDIVKSGSVDHHTPNALTFFFRPFEVLLRQSLKYQSTLAPIHKASVFLVLSLRLDILPKQSIISKESSKDSSEPSKIRVLSSPYWLSLISLSLTVMPRISFF